MISARDELAHYIASLNEREAEEALDILQRHFDPLPSVPSCPSCGERDLDLLVWRDDDNGEWVECCTCGFCWDPNSGGPLDRRLSAEGGL